MHQTLLIEKDTISLLPLVLYVRGLQLVSFYPCSRLSNVSQVEETTIVPMVSHVSMGVEVDIPFLGPVASLFSLISDAFVTIVRLLFVAVPLDDILVLGCGELLYFVILNGMIANSVNLGESRLIEGKRLVLRVVWVLWGEV